MAKKMENSKKKTSIKEKATEFYRNNYMKLLIIPFLMLTISLIIIGVQYSQTGDFINKGISLKGGLTVTIPTHEAIDIDALNEIISGEMPDADFNIRTLSAYGEQAGVMIESDIVESDDIDKILSVLEEYIKMERNEFTIEEVGSRIGERFFIETFRALIFAFIFMGIVIFLFFKNPVISGAVILSAFSDIFVTIAILNLIGFRVGTAGIAALLMMISYSVDTDVLLSTRVTRRKQGTVFDAVLSSLRTGMTMTLTTLVVVSAGMIFSQSPILKEIMFIVFIGLMVDIINTWLQNAGLIRWYYKKKKNED